MILSTMRTLVSKLLSKFQLMLFIFKLPPFLGLIKLKTNAKMETTVCLLCLPEEHSEYLAENCTVVGYGRPSAIALNAFERGEIAAFSSTPLIMTKELI